jgi:two-component system cell cycle sensor histidine kinase/response regulator CckA
MTQGLRQERSGDAGPGEGAGPGAGAELGPAGQSRGGVGDHREGSPSSSENRRGGVILVADDDAGVRLVTSEMLKLLGCEVLLAADGEEAVARFRESAGRIQLVFLDLTMPVKGGAEALVEILAIRPDARVVLASGLDELEAVRSVSGAVGFMQKPYTLEQLGAMLLRLLGGSG